MLQRVDNLANATEPSNSDWNLLNGLRTNPALKDALISTYIYKPLVGVVTVTDPGGGMTMSYEYDSRGRLKSVRNAEMNQTERYIYHYQNISDYEDLDGIRSLYCESQTGAVVREMQLFRSLINTEGDLSLAFNVTPVFRLSFYGLLSCREPGCRSR